MSIQKLPEDRFPPKLRKKRSNELATSWYSDQILPFDITLGAVNEQGAMAGAKIFGVEILNEGSGISIDDAVTEMQATFVARAVEPMQAVPSKFDGGIGGQRSARMSRSDLGPPSLPAPRPLSFPPPTTPLR
jgi:hypothetical protein